MFYSKFTNDRKLCKKKSIKWILRLKNKLVVKIGFLIKQNLRFNEKIKLSFLMFFFFVFKKNLRDKENI